MPESAHVSNWLNQAHAIDDPASINVPLHVLTGEAVEAAKFVKQYWEPGEGRPGLSSAGARLPASVADEILSLEAAVADQQTNWRLTLQQYESHSDWLERGVFLLKELVAVMEWYFEDGQQTVVDDQLAALQDAHNPNPVGADALAQALNDYATLAAMHAKALDGVGAFDAALIGEAKALAGKLGEVRQGPPQASEESRNAVRLRNQLATLLQDRVRNVRSAARFVFRNQPEIARMASSAYERRRRAALRRKKSAAEVADDS